jgi:hypothetical protein
VKGGGRGGDALPDDRRMVGPRLREERAHGRRKEEHT